jgi:hypothetical protein
MQARSILMNWKQLRRTENNIHRSTVPYVEARTNFDKACHGFRSNRGRECARGGAGFSRFLHLVPSEGESQTTGKLCVLHSFYKDEANRYCAVFLEELPNSLQIAGLNSNGRR